MKGLKRRADGRFRCVYKGKEFYGKTSQEALKAREKYIDLVKAGLKSDDTSVLQYSGEWLPVHKSGVAKNTYNSYANYLDRMNEKIGDKLLSEVTATDIMSVYNLFLGQSNSTIQKVKFLVTSMFDSAVQDGYINRNPCKSVAPAKGTAGSHRAITDEERELILSTPADFRLPALVMLYAGLRRGEVLALKSSDIDFKKKIIHVRTAVHFEGNQRVLGDPKTENGIRDVPLFKILQNELKDVDGLIAGKEYSQTGFTRAWEKYVNTIEFSVNGCQKRWYGRRKEDRLKNPVKFAQIARLEKAAADLIAENKKSEAEEKQAEADSLRLAGWKSFTVRPHDLRHSFVTMLCDAKVEIDQAMKWCGHGDERMIRKIYDHVSSYRTERAINDVEKMLKKR